jgi:hypothetical protein
MAVLTRRIALPPGERLTDYRIASADVPIPTTEPTEEFALAVGGDAEALARLPRELRNIAEEVIELDASITTSTPRIAADPT